MAPILAPFCEGFHGEFASELDKALVRVCELVTGRTAKVVWLSSPGFAWDLSNLRTLRAGAQTRWAPDGLSLFLVEAGTRRASGGRQHVRQLTF